MDVRADGEFVEATGKHEVVKVRRESVRRSLRVLRKDYLTPRMLRIVFASDELRGFHSPSPDDHIKLFFPTASGEKAGRDFTPRAWDESAGTLTVHFALHAVGPAADWARSAQVGDLLEMGGPRGSTVVPDDFDWYLMVGDATALPSFGRRLEGLRAGVAAFVFALVEGEGERQVFETAAALECRWLRAAEDAQESLDAVLGALADFALPAGDGFIWIASEASVARECYRYLVEERGHPKEWVKAATYWTLGAAE